MVTKKKTDLSKVLSALAVILVIGILGGALGAVFHHTVDHATAFRAEHSWLIALLPLAGLVITWLYRAFGTTGLGTGVVIDASHGERDVPLLLLPAIFLATCLTHLFGGSAGREGAALQMGGALGEHTARLFHLEERALGRAVMWGMSALFSAMFGTPVAAAVFTVEIAGMPGLYLSSLLPCLLAAFVAKGVAALLHTAPLSYTVTAPAIEPATLAKVALLAILCGLVSLLFCRALHLAEHLAERFLQNTYLRVFCGGCVIAVATFALGTFDYNGAGMDVVSAALAGESRPEAFFLKILFTAVTIACGFKGGEVVPSLFIGATFGCFVGGVLGLDPGFAAAVGMISVFCGCVNAPVASVLLSMEVFGLGGVVFFAISCVLSYFVSGRHGFYANERLVYPKLDRLASLIIRR